MLEGPKASWGPGKVLCYEEKMDRENNWHMVCILVLVMVQGIYRGVVKTNSDTSNWTGKVITPLLDGLLAMIYSGTVKWLARFPS